MGTGLRTAPPSCDNGRGRVQLAQTTAMHNAPKAVCQLLLIMAKAYSSNSDRAVLDLGSASRANDATRDTAKSP